MRVIEREVGWLGCFSPQGASPRKGLDQGIEAQWQPRRLMTDAIRA